MRMGAELLATARFYLEFYDWAREEFELAGQYVYFLADVLKAGGDDDLSKALSDGLVALVDTAAEALEGDS